MCVGCEWAGARVFADRIGRVVATRTSATTRRLCGRQWHNTRTVPAPKRHPFQGGSSYGNDNFTYGGGATVAEWLDCSPPAKANRVQSPTSSLPDLRMWESCRMIPLIGGVFSVISRFPRPFHSSAAPYSTRSRDLDVKNGRISSLVRIRPKNTQGGSTRHCRQLPWNNDTCPQREFGFQSQASSTIARPRTHIPTSLTIDKRKSHKVVAEIAWSYRFVDLLSLDIEPRPSCSISAQLLGSPWGFDRETPRGVTRTLERGYVPLLPARAVPPPAANYLVTDCRPSVSGGGGHESRRPPALSSRVDLGLALVPGSKFARSLAVPSCLHVRLACLPLEKMNRVRFPAGSLPGFLSHVGIVPDDAVGQRVFSGISRFLRPCIPALLHTHLASPSSAIKTQRLRAARNISTPHFPPN
ncbi:hypothetical protein PR048_024902 [Dryococelus australis]|uniref:Uncharacterized protein n=1 Tax=Dryococelus australis TaxID=614101 RepID=A0ABQ9GPV4_9NEOP|nr:hypothetical protein PR048_024902 [Dryococelus australis]